MKKVSLLLLALLLSLNVKSQTFNPQLAAMLQDTLSYYTGLISNIKGLSVSVYIPGQGMWQGTSGISYTGAAITEGMEFGIASNTKLFTSTAMLILQENGIISLDDQLQDWLPTYPNIDPNITIRQLLNHTSGISDPIFVSPWMDTIMANPTRVFTPAEVVGWTGAPTFAPGTNWGYSNINYILAGMIAETATGQSIAQIIRDSILTPLNMDSTFYDVEEAAMGVIAHCWWNGIDYHDTSRVGINSAGGAAGAVFSTSSEMSQWYHALFSGQIINQASLGELTTFVGTGNAASDYGLGLERETTQGRTYWGHGGAIWGYRSKMMYDTCIGTVVCGLSNSYPSGMDAVTFLLYRCVQNHIPACATGIISGQVTVCQGETGVTYSVPAIANATSYQWILPSGATGSSVTNSIVVDYTAGAVSGDIVVRGVNNYGAGGWLALPVIVNVTPATPVVSLTGNQLTSSAPLGNQWYDSNGAINGATGQTYVATNNDDYYCIVTLSGCSSDTSNIVNVNLTGVSAFASELQPRIYPNPTTQELFIELPYSPQIAVVEICNTLGQCLHHSTLQDKTVVNMLPFAAGIYVVKVSCGDKTIVKQINRL